MAASGDVDITYVPADCGSLIHGKSKAPAAFQRIDIAGKLRDAGVGNVTETSALEAPAVWRSTVAPANSVRNEALNLEVNVKAGQTLASNLRRSQAPTSAAPAISPPFQLILGGECCMLPGLLSGLYASPALAKSRNPRIGLIYIDADTDLYSPFDARSTGNFAGQTMAHLTGAPPGGLDSFMSRFCLPAPDRAATASASQPLCNASNTVFFGTNLDSNSITHLGYLFTHHYRVIPSTAVASDPQDCARTALQYLLGSRLLSADPTHGHAAIDAIHIHLDVDAIDPGEYPLANVPNFTGVKFEQMMRALEVLVLEANRAGAGNLVMGLSIAEVNPDHDPGLEMIARLAARVAEILGRRVNKMSG